MPTNAETLREEARQRARDWWHEHSSRLVIFGIVDETADAVSAPLIAQIEALRARTHEIQKRGDQEAARLRHELRRVEHEAARQVQRAQQRADDALAELDRLKERIKALESPPPPDRADIAYAKAIYAVDREREA